MGRSIYIKANVTTSQEGQICKQQSKRIKCKTNQKRRGLLKRKKKKVY